MGVDSRRDAGTQRIDVGGQRTDGRWENGHIDHRDTQRSDSSAIISQCLSVSARKIF